MMKIAFVLAAAAAAVMLTTAPLATPAKAQDLKMAQGIDVQIGRDRYDRYDRDRRAWAVQRMGGGRNVSAASWRSRARSTSK